MPVPESSRVLRNLNQYVF